jgi:single-strand DNA-binding protein
MFQKWIGIGRITADPELKHTANGTPVTRFTLAVDRGFKDESGEKQTDFIDIVVWREQAENCAKYLSKGAPAAVEGRLQIRTYEDSQGIRRRAAEIVANRVVFLPNGKKGDSGIEPPPWPEEEPGNSAPFGESEINLDEIPF